MSHGSGKAPAQQGGPAWERADTAASGEGTPAKNEATPLQERLEALVDSERKREELQQELREQRWAAQQHDAARRLEELEEALAEARAEIAKREQVEQTLGRVRLEAAKLAIELGQAERDAEEMRSTANPLDGERLAEVEEELSEARAEAERERAELEGARAEFERAATEADRTLARERSEREREQERLRAIEELLEAATGAEAARPEAPDTPAVPPALKAFRATRSDIPDQIEAPESRAAPDEQQAPERSGRLRRRKRVFQTRGRTCAVCKSTEANSPGGLKAAGWALGPEIDLCPDCQEKGWQLPKGGSLPFRRSSHRDEAS